MKWIGITIIFTGIICVGFISSSKRKPVSPGTKYIQGSFAPVAVLELFTSEGCSSCPPADRLLTQLMEQDSGIFAMSFHVDYWNRLGWKDPFSSSIFSDRQRQYGRQFQLQSIYTPQLIVNGEYEMVGSDRSSAGNFIKKVLQEKAAVKLQVSEISLSGDQLSFQVNPEGDWKGTRLLAALLQKNASIEVRAGENKGSRLSHTHVVRSFEQQTATEHTSFTLQIPKDVNDRLLVVYVQRDGGKITGAVSAIF